MVKGEIFNTVGSGEFNASVDSTNTTSWRREGDGIAFTANSVLDRVTALRVEFFRWKKNQRRVLRWMRLSSTLLDSRNSRLFFYIRGAPGEAWHIWG